MILTGDTRVFNAQISQSECKKLEAVMTQPKVYLYEKQDLSPFVTEPQVHTLISEQTGPIIERIVLLEEAQGGNVIELEKRIKKNEETIATLVSDATVIGSVDNKIDEALRTEELLTK